MEINPRRSLEVIKERRKESSFRARWRGRVVRCFAINFSVGRRRVNRRLVEGSFRVTRRGFERTIRNWFAGKFGFVVGLIAALILPDQVFRSTGSDSLSLSLSLDASRETREKLARVTARNLASFWKTILSPASKNSNGHAIERDLALQRSPTLFFVSRANRISGLEYF